VGEFVRLEVDEASRVGTIRLDRPPVNARSAQIQDELLAAAGEAARDERVGAVGSSSGAREGVRRRGGTSRR
jgi:enoyl-CoA hydratase/carnithine racemase